MDDPYLMVSGGGRHRGAGINSSRRITKTNGADWTGGRYQGRRAKTYLGRQIAAGNIGRLSGAGAMHRLMSGGPYRKGGK